MTNQLNVNQDQQAAEETKPRMPTMVVKQRIGRGKTATYERLGVAWENEDGSLYVKLHGTQVIGGGFNLYPIKGNEESEAQVEA